MIRFKTTSVVFGGVYSIGFYLLNAHHCVSYSFDSHHNHWKLVRDCLLPPPALVIKSMLIVVGSIPMTRLMVKKRRRGLERVSRLLTPLSWSMLAPLMTWTEMFARGNSSVRFLLKGKQR